MTTSQPKPGERVADVRFDDDAMSVDLADGRTITVPLAWYPRLLEATPAQREKWESCGGGYGIHWPEIDEDLSTQGLLEGAPAPRRRSERSAPNWEWKPLNDAAPYTASSRGRWRERRATRR